MADHVQIAGKQFQVDDDQGGQDLRFPVTVTNPPDGTALDVCLKSMSYTGTLGALNAALNMDCEGKAGTMVFEVAGTWKGKIVVEGGINGTYNNLSVVQPGGAISFTGINNDNQNGVYRALIIAGYTHMRLRMSEYTSGTATITANTSQQIPTAYVWQLNQANLLSTAYQGGTWTNQIATGATVATVESRKQTPTGNALNVQIGPGDVISNIPVVMDFPHHQRHEGETFRVQYVDTALDTNTVKFAIVVPTYGTVIRAPHLLMHCDVYNGAAKIDLYESATYTSGGSATSYNVNRNSANVAGAAIYSGVTSTNGTLMPFSFYAGAGTRGAGGTRSADEIELKSNTTYRLDLIGLVAGTDAILILEWYEDLGV